MAVEFRKVVKEGYESFHAEALEKLAHLDAEVEVKVDEFRNSLIAECEDKRNRLNQIIDLCTEEKEFEVPDVEPVCCDCVEPCDSPVCEEGPVNEEVVGE